MHLTICEQSRSTGIILQITSQKQGNNLGITVLRNNELEWFTRVSHLHSRSCPDIGKKCTSDTVRKNTKIEAQNLLGCTAVRAAFIIALIMEAARTSETSVDIKLRTRPRASAFPTTSSLTVWSSRVQSVAQREHNLSPLQRSTINAVSESNCCLQCEPHEAHKTKTQRYRLLR
jgi:hypothetical protein